jgi:hypothetical protein
MKPDSLDRFSINTEIFNFMKILPMEAELFRAERRTDREAEANSRFSQFCKDAKNLVHDYGFSLMDRQKLTRHNIL